MLAVQSTNTTPLANPSDTPWACRYLLRNFTPPVVTITKMDEQHQDSKSSFTGADIDKTETMSTFKRDRHGNAKKQDGFPKPAPKQIERNALTPMFEHLRDELDEHHDRRDRIGKASRDITALSKKM